MIEEMESATGVLQRLVICGAFTLALGLSACAQNAADQTANDMDGEQASEAGDAQVSRVYQAPEGVTILDIEQDGPDLIVALPDGEIMRIENGMESYDSILIDGLVFPLANPGIVE